MSDEITIGGYSFEELTKLAKTNIEEFDRIATEIKQKELDRLCCERPEKERRLRGLQFKIDAKMNGIKNPLVRAQFMQNMLLEEGLFPLREALMDLQTNIDQAPIDLNTKQHIDNVEKKTQTSSNATILPFPKQE